MTNFEACEALVEAMKHSKGRAFEIRRIEEYGKP